MDLVDVRSCVPAESATWQAGDAYLAGGTWLFSEPQPETHRLLDLQGLGWPGLVRAADGGLEIGATCTIAALAADLDLPVVFRWCCDALLGSFKVWNTATVGGNVCLALPAGPMTSLTAALDGVGELHAPDGGVRTLPVVDLVAGPRRTALRPGELLRSIRLPAAAVHSRTVCRRISLSDQGRSAALVIGRVDADGTTVLTVTASTPRPVQVRFGRLPSGDELRTAVTAAVAARGGWYADVHGDPQWRAAMTNRLVDEVCTELGGPP